MAGQQNGYTSYSGEASEQGKLYTREAAEQGKVHLYINYGGEAAEHPAKNSGTASRA